MALRGGEQMLVECPAEEYAEPLLHFLEHKGDNTARDMKQRLRGDYVAVSLDRWFVGEIDGRIASQMGYMLARDTLDVGVATCTRSRNIAVKARPRRSCTC